MIDLSTELVDDVYDTLCGQLLPEYRLSWVENAFEPGGRCDRDYVQMAQAYGRLCERLGVADEDQDVETVINSLMDIQRELCRKMFQCGVRWGRGEL